MVDDGLGVAVVVADGLMVTVDDEVAVVEGVDEGVGENVGDDSTWTTGITGIKTTDSVGNGGGSTVIDNRRPGVGTIGVGVAVVGKSSATSSGLMSASRARITPPNTHRLPPASSITAIQRRGCFFFTELTAANRGTFPDRYYRRR